MKKIKKELRLMISASYDDSGENVFKQSDEGYRREAGLGRPVPQTNIKHSSSEPDIDKFLVPIGIGDKFVTVLDLCLLDAYNSGYQGQIPVVGNKEKTRLTVERFVDLFRPEKRDKYFRFVDAGKELSLGNTVEKGADKNNNPTVIFCGDTGLLYDLDPVLNDPNNFNHAVNYDLNCRELMFPYLDASQFRDNGFFPRNYHLIVLDDRLCPSHPVPKAVKEANIFTIDYKTVSDKIDRFYGARKSASGKNKKAFLEFILEDNLWKKTLPEFMTHIEMTVETALKFFPKEILKKIAPSKKETPFLKYRVRLSFLEELGSIVVGEPVSLKASHRDPNRLIDIDSYQDLAWILELFHRAGNPERIYPYWEQAKMLARTTPDLIEAGVKMASPDYINWLFSQHETLRGQEPFDNSGRFKPTIWKNDPRLDKAVECLEKRLNNWRRRA